MKITKTLPQFDKKAGLFVVVGSQEGKLYCAKNGTITKVKSIAIKTPRYSDNEGFFGSRGKGTAMVFGSAREKNALASKARKEFLDALCNELARLVREEKNADIYLFAPAHLLGSTQKSFPRNVQKRVVSTIAGDYRDAHPFVLLEKISE